MQQCVGRSKRPPDSNPLAAPVGALAAGGKDTFLRVWSQDGHPLQQLDLGDL